MRFSEREGFSERGHWDTVACPRKGGPDTPTPPAPTYLDTGLRRCKEPNRIAGDSLDLPVAPAPPLTRLVDPSEPRCPHPPVGPSPALTHSVVTRYCDSGQQLAWAGLSHNSQVLGSGGLAGYQIQELPGWGHDLTPGKVIDHRSLQEPGHSWRKKVAPFVEGTASRPTTLTTTPSM